MSRLHIQSGASITSARVVYRRIRPFPIYGAGKSHSAGDTPINGAVGGISGVSSWQKDDLILAVSSHDFANVEDTTAEINRTYTPAPGKGWWPIVGMTNLPVFAHRWTPGGSDLADMSSVVSVSSGTQAGLASAVAGFRAAGEIQEQTSFATGTGNLTLPSIDVEEDGSLAVMTGVLHYGTSGTAVNPSASVTIATPSGWTHISTGSRWYPGVGFFCKAVNRGATGTVACSNAGGGSFHGTRPSHAFLFVIKPIVSRLPKW